MKCRLPTSLLVRRPFIQLFIYLTSVSGAQGSVIEILSLTRRVRGPVLLGPTPYKGNRLERLIQGSSVMCQTTQIS